MVEHFFSRWSAQKIADDVVTVRAWRPGAFFQLELTVDIEGNEIIPPIFIRECTVENTSTGGELLRCVSKEGEDITILLPHPSKRKEFKAEVLIGVQ